MADDQGSTPSVPKSIIEVTAFMPEALAWRTSSPVVQTPAQKEKTE